MNIEKALPLTETTCYILLSLLEPAHGYAIMQTVDQLSEGRVRIAAGTLYGAIENLLKQKWIQAVDSGDKRRKVYALTAEGEAVLRMDLARMQRLVAISQTLLP